MLKKHAAAIATVVFVADLLLTLAAFLLTYVLYRNIPNAIRIQYSLGRLVELGSYLWLLLFIIPIWATFLQVNGVYRSHRTDSRLRELGQLAKAIAWSGLSLFAFLALTKSMQISRPFIAAFVLVDSLTLIGFRTVLRGIARRSRAAGHNFRTVLIVGTGPGARAHADRVLQNPQWGLRLLGFLADDGASAEALPGNAPVLGHHRDVRRLLCEYVVDEAVVAVGPDRIAALEPLFLECEQVGVKTRLVVDFFRHRIARVELEDMEGAPMLTFSTTPPEDWQMIAKRAMDIAGSSIFLLSFSWLYALIYAAIKITDPGPVLYKQIRVGMNGRRFTFLKFRSMVMNAEKLKAQLAAKNEMDGPVFKMKNDPRVTKVGRILRKFSLDELPQMWNVFVGEMSLVGPRPPIPAEVERYESWARRRLSVRPGLTCLWQIAGRNNINFQQWMELDLAYIDNWSLLLDIKILLKTVPAVLSGRGAS